MALPVKSDLEALSYSFDGSPFCQVAMESTDGLNSSFDGSPFWAIYEAATDTFVPLIMWM